MLALSAIGAEKNAKELKPRPMVGAYYFDGWAGRSAFADDPKQPWAQKAPTHLTQRMLDEFPEREPV
jgi:hypothetical protein